jgi:3-isopropylmalate dehydrogenase
LSKSREYFKAIDKLSTVAIGFAIFFPAISGAKDKNGKIRSMYEPVHGSAPDIAGKNIANPIATVLSLSMALKYSLDLDKEAEQLDQAVQSVLDDGLRTKDIISKNMKEVSTSDMGDAIIAKLK